MAAAATWEKVGDTYWYTLGGKRLYPCKPGDKYARGTWMRCPGAPPRKGLIETVKGAAGTILAFVFPVVAMNKAILDGVGSKTRSPSSALAPAPALAPVPTPQTTSLLPIIVGAAALGVVLMLRSRR